MHPSRAVGILLLVVGLAALASESPLRSAQPAPATSPAGETIALVGGTLLDVSSFGRRAADVKDSVVVIRDGAIVAAGPRKSVKVPAGARTIDVAGRFLVPGLVDSFAALGKQAHANAYLYFGVTSIVGVEGQPRRPDLYRDADPSPRLYPLGIVGYGPKGDDVVELSEPETLAQIDEEAKKGTKVILIHYPITAERTAQIVKKAHALGLGTIGELGMTRYEDAIGAGVDAFVHTSRYSLGLAANDTRLAVAGNPFGPPRDAFYRSLVTYDPNNAEFRSYAALLGRSPIALIPTMAMNYLELPGHKNPWLVPGARIVDPKDIHQPANPATGERDETPTEGPHAFPPRLAEALLRLEEGYRSAGAKYLAGSGTTAFGTIPGVSLHTELEQLQRIGLPPRQILAAATSTLGVTFGWPKIGEIKPGYAADLLVLKGDPLADLANLRQIEWLILKGKIVDREALLGAAGAHP